MTIEEQLASMPGAVSREWTWDHEEPNGKLRTLLVGVEEGTWYFEKKRHTIEGIRMTIDSGLVRDGGHLAELYRWLVKGDSE